MRGNAGCSSHEVFLQVLWRPLAEESLTLLTTVDNGPTR